jgi:hypothetical protein
MMDVRRLSPSDTAAFRAARLECLELHPDPFGTVWEVEREQPDSHFRHMLEKHQFWGGFVDGSLAGIVGFFVMPRAKERHRDVLYARFGFRTYGLEQSSLKIGGVAIDQEYQVLLFP